MGATGYSTSMRPAYMRAVKAGREWAHDIHRGDIQGPGDVRLQQKPVPLDDHMHECHAPGGAGKKMWLGVVDNLQRKDRPWPFLPVLTFVISVFSHVR